MKVVELLKIGQKLLEMLQKSCIKTEDVKYIGMFDDFEEMSKHGEKKSYIVAMLAEKYGISERRVYYLIKKFSGDCKNDAV